MKISMREALFTGDEVDEWAPTTWEQYFTMMPAGKGNVAYDRWTQEQVDMLHNRFGKDKFEKDTNRLKDSNASWVSLDIQNNKIVLNDRKTESRFAINQTGLPYLISNNHFAIVKNIGVPQDKLESFLSEYAEELDEILSSPSKIEAAYRIKASWDIK